MLLKKCVTSFIKAPTFLVILFLLYTTEFHGFIKKDLFIINKNLRYRAFIQIEIYGLPYSH